MPEGCPLPGWETWVVYGVETRPRGDIQTPGDAEPVDPVRVTGVPQTSRPDDVPLTARGPGLLVLYPFVAERGLVRAAAAAFDLRGGIELIAVDWNLGARASAMREGGGATARRTSSGSSRVASWWSTTAGAAVVKIEMLSGAAAVGDSVVYPALTSAVGPAGVSAVTRNRFASWAPSSSPSPLARLRERRSLVGVRLATSSVSVAWESLDSWRSWPRCGSAFTIVSKKNLPRPARRAHQGVFDTRRSHC